MAVSSSNRRAAAVLAELGARLAVATGPATESAPHVRRTLNVDRLLFCFVLASVPAWLVGVWNLGYQLTQALVHTQGGALSGWQGAVYAGMGMAFNDASPLSCVVLGLLYYLPLLFVVLLATIFWEVLFASRRGRGVDPGWLMTAWLFVLLLPPSTSLLLAVVAVSFGVVFGAHIFGGTGKYLVSPALLGVLFLDFSYPGFAQAVLPISGYAGTSTWSLVALATEPGADFVALLLGRELGAVGTGSALACMAGAAYLVYAGAASWRTLAGALMGLFVGAGILNLFAGEDLAWGISWHWHLVLGNFAFGVAFLATDPSAGALTRPARWSHGALIGLLTVVIRVVDPSHPEGSLYAILLAGLAVPLLDYLVVRRYRLPDRSARVT